MARTRPVSEESEVQDPYRGCARCACSALHHDSWRYAFAHDGACLECGECEQFVEPEA